MGAFASYGVISNLNYGTAMGMAWLAYVKKTGLAPTAPGQWPSFLAFYAGGCMGGAWHAAAGDSHLAFHPLSTACVVLGGGHKHPKAAAFTHHVPRLLTPLPASVSLDSSSNMCIQHACRGTAALSVSAGQPNTWQ
jgi:hypothetical protein